MRRKTLRVFGLCVLAMLLAAGRAPSAGSDHSRKVALIIGNGAYATSPLKNPTNDAADMAKLLAELGFFVIHKQDATQRQMEDGIREFQAKLGRDVMGLFFYAGHGMQVNGVNYLIPVGAKIRQESDVKYEAVDAGRVLDAMYSAGNTLNIVILDACRDNPFARSFRSSQKGLARMDAPTGTFIAYATAPGDVASDGDGRNGVFTKYMLEYMRVPSLEVDKVLKKVRVSVMRETAKRQVPWQSSSLTGDFYFSGGPPAGDQREELADQWSRINKERQEIAALKQQLGERTRQQEQSKAEQESRAKKELDEARAELEWAKAAPAPVVQAAAPAPAKPQAVDFGDMKLMVLLQEKCVQCGVEGMGLAEAELLKILAEKGFDVVDKSQLEAAREKDQMRMAIAGNEKAAVSLAATHGAQYLLMGTATIQDVGEAVPGTGLKSIQTTIQAKLLSAQDGRVLGSTVEREAAAHISSLTGASLALQKAAQKVVEGTVIKSILAQASKAVQEGGRLRLYVTGVKDLATYSALTKALEATPSLTQLKRERWNQDSGLLVLEARFAGSSEDLAVSLDEKHFGKHKISVRDFAARQIDLAVR